MILRTLSLSATLLILATRTGMAQEASLRPAASPLFLTPARHSLVETSDLASASPGEKGALVGGAVGLLTGVGLGYAFCRGMRDSASDSCTGTTVGSGITFALIGAVVGAFVAGHRKSAATP